MNAGDGVQMDREQMRVISFLGIPEEQKPLLAAKWHHWRMRRMALDKTLAAALHSFNQSLPSRDTLPSELMEALECYAPHEQEGDGEAAAVVAGGVLLERRGSENESGSGEMCGGTQVKAEAGAGAHGFVVTGGPAEDSLKHGALSSGPVSCAAGSWR